MSPRKPTRPDLEQEIREEIRFHLEQRTREMEEEGASPAEAVRRARAAFGDPDVIAERTLREAKRGAQSGEAATFFLEFAQDIRYALRSFSRSRGFSAVALLTMALGIGATTAMFSLVDGLVLRSLTYPDADRLVWAWGSRVDGVQRSSVNPQEFLDYRARNSVFAQFAATVTFAQTVTLTGRGDPVSLQLSTVSGNYLTTFGVRPFLGRSLIISDEQEGRNDVVVLSYDVWVNRFGADRSIVGSTVTIDGRSVEVVGVMPDDFHPPQAAELWMPMPFQQTVLNRQSHFMRPIGRLGRDVTIEQAQADLDRIARDLEIEYPETSGGWSLRLVSLQDQLSTRLSRPFWLLFGAVAFLLSMACANVAGLLLVRASARAQEVAVRAALGAGRRRIARQMLTESFVLAVLGSVLGVGVGYSILHGLIALEAISLPAWAEVGMDGRVIAFAILVTFVTAAFFGLIPAIVAIRPNHTGSLASGFRASAGGAHVGRIRAALVVGEVAAAAVLLVGGGLFMKSLVKLYQVDPGFRVEDAFTIAVDLPQSRYPQPQQAITFYDQLEQELTALPGAVAVGIVSQLPLSGQMNDVPFAIEGRGDDTNTTIDQRFTSDGYFNAMSIPVLRGRGFSELDARESAPVMLISERMAELHFPNEDPIGRRIRIFDSVYEIVGLVGDVRHRSLATDVYPTVYLPTLSVLNGFIVIRARQPGPGFAEAVRAGIQGIDKELAVGSVRTLERVVDASVARPRFNALLLTSFAMLALILTLVGVYGVVSYSVSERSREIGIRMALGATRRDVEKLVLGVGLKLGLAGAVLGLLGAVGLSRVTRSLLFGVQAIDAATYATIAVLLIGSVILACWLPARRASGIDPITATRSD